jgi:hypothetical protein
VYSLTHSGNRPVQLSPVIGTLPVFRGLSKTNLPGYVSFFQFLRNFHQLTAFEQAEMILYAALDPAVAGRAKKGDFVRCLDHFKLLQSPIN